MTLLEGDVARAEEIRASLGTKNKAHAVSIALYLTAFLSARIKRGDELVLRSGDGELARVVLDDILPKRKAA